MYSEQTGVAAVGVLAINIAVSIIKRVHFHQVCDCDNMRFVKNYIILEFLRLYVRNNVQLSFMSEEQ